jgi:hypothetical protein
MKPEAKNNEYTLKQEETEAKLRKACSSTILSATNIK